MAEVYWQALARDVQFAQYATDPLISQAATDLSRLSAVHTTTSGGVVTPATIFRGLAPGDLTGPMVSQFLWSPVAYGAMTIDQRYPVAALTDHLTTYAGWLANQQGHLPPPGKPGATPPPTRYICTGRDLATMVHFDFPYQAYLNACLILLSMGAPLNAGNPYRRLKAQVPGLTFGGVHCLDLVALAANAAAKANWYQKWLLHRRLRPGAFGGRVHLHRAGSAAYPIHPDLLERSVVLYALYRTYGTYLLPMAYPEGAPLHPSYPASHTTTAGACVTMLKAFFDGSYVLPRPVVASADGRTLAAYTGPALTVSGELNKLASNIHMGRDFAGVHYRSDGVAGLLLGEEVAIGILRDQSGTFREDFRGFTFTKFDGTTIIV
jgi:hypothetical protein